MILKFLKVLSNLIMQNLLICLLKQHNLSPLYQRTYTMYTMFVDGRISGLCSRLF